MSHELKEHDIQEGRTMAWHRKTKVKADLTIENCWLRTWDYIVRTVQVDGKDTAFGILGVNDVEGLFIGRPFQKKTFKPVFNAGLLEKIAKAIDGQGLTLESNGTVFNRGRLYLSFGMEAAKFQAAGREFHAFLNIGNGNDMSSPLWVNTSNICTVCDNTFTANMENDGLIMSVKKTQFSEFKLSDMGRAISAMLKGQTEFAKTLGMLCDIKCSETTAREFFAGFIGEPGKALSERAGNTVDQLVVLFRSGNGNDGNDFSDVFQALTDWYTHNAANGQDDDAARWKNFVSSEFGSGKKKKMEAWNILTSKTGRDGMIALGRDILKQPKTAPVAS